MFVKFWLAAWFPDMNYKSTVPPFTCTVIQWLSRQQCSVHLWLRQPFSNRQSEINYLRQALDTVVVHCHRANYQQSLEKSQFYSMSKAWILHTYTECVSPFSLALPCTFAVLCAFQSLPWCGAAVCDPVSRLCAWTNAGVISVGYISIFITVIWIFALPLWYHCTRFMWRIWLEDVCQDLTSRGAQTHVILGPKYEISGEKTDLNLVIWSLHITH